MRRRLVGLPAKVGKHSNSARAPGRSSISCPAISVLSWIRLLRPKLFADKRLQHDVGQRQDARCEESQTALREKSSRKKRQLQRKWWLGSRQPRRPCQRRRQREKPRPSGRQRPEHGSDGRRPRQMLRRLTRATPTPWRLSRRRSRAAPRPPLKFDECREGSWRGRAVTYHTPVSFNKRVAAFETESNGSDASVIARNEKRPAGGRSEGLRSWIDYIG